MDETTADVAIVGSGIAGGALAVRLARAGLAVTVLERSVEFGDRVRGEAMFPWGCAELARSGLLDIAMRAEGTVAARAVPYGDSMSPDAAEAAAMDTTAVVPGAAGMLNLSHPGACRELVEAAVDLGAEVVRGSRRVRVTAGPQPAVRYEHNLRQRIVKARVVVGADGRNSTVRRQLGIPLPPRGRGPYGEVGQRSPLDHPDGSDRAGRPGSAGQARLMIVVTGRPKRRSTCCGTSEPSQRETRLGRVATMTSSMSRSARACSMPSSGWGLPRCPSASTPSSASSARIRDSRARASSVASSSVPGPP